eukprot:6190946-Pleurochrysis_carterae.AAC.3
MKGEMQTIATCIGTGLTAGVPSTRHRLLQLRKPLWAILSQFLVHFDFRQLRSNFRQLPSTTSVEI